jgi:hypothetical protein
MNKDWTGNKKSTFTTLGASNHSEGEREMDDYYATEPMAMELLLEKENFSNVWENACGQGHLAEILKQKGILSKATDLVDRGYGVGGVDFLQELEKWEGDIITNPPYKFAQEFVERAMDIMVDGRKLAMFLKLTFLEGKGRKKMFLKYPPKIIYVSSSRLKCALGGKFEDMGSSAAAYGWFVWVKGFIGDPIIKWIN